MKKDKLEDHKARFTESLESLAEADRTNVQEVGQRLFDNGYGVVCDGYTKDVEYLGLRTDRSGDRCNHVPYKNPVDIHVVHPGKLSNNELDDLREFTLCARVDQLTHIPPKTREDDKYVEVMRYAGKFKETELQFIYLIDSDTTMENSHLE